MPRKYTEAQKRAVAKYHAEKTDDIRVRAPKGTKERWRAAADERGKSLQRLIIDAVEKYITEN
jgi:predicted HicB family RNase H-like nuclease